jgi:hypothetical protein
MESLKHILVNGWFNSRPVIGNRDVDFAPGGPHPYTQDGVASGRASREEAVRLSVFRFAVREAGEPPEPSPVRRAGVSVVSLGQCLGGKGPEQLRKNR